MHIAATHVHHRLAKAEQVAAKSMLGMSKIVGWSVCHCLAPAKHHVNGY